MTGAGDVEPLGDEKCIMETWTEARVTITNTLETLDKLMEKLETHNTQHSLETPETQTRD